MKNNTRRILALFALFLLIFTIFGAVSHHVASDNGHGDLEESLFCPLCIVGDLLSKVVPIVATAAAIAFSAEILTEKKREVIVFATMRSFPMLC